MKHILFAGIAVWMAIGTATGQDDVGAAARGAACSQVADSLARLTCFDKAFPKDVAAGGSASPTAPAEPVPTAGGGFGAWIVDESKSPIDDSPKVVAYVAAESQGFTVTPAGLIARCIENTTSVIITTANFGFGEDTGGVTYRLDGNPAVTERWGMSTDGRSVGLWNGSTAIPFLRRLATVEKFVARVEIGSRQQDLVLDVTGIAAVVDKIGEACQWPAL